MGGSTAAGIPLLALSTAPALPSLAGGRPSALPCYRRAETPVWVAMADVLVNKLCDPSYEVFRETWSTYEGQRWYWNTEQEEPVYRGAWDTPGLVRGYRVVSGSGWACTHCLVEDGSSIL
ncbi:MAG: hypothetical protein ABWW70_03040 [Thermoproteota archaeon]